MKKLLVILCLAGAMPGTVQAAYPTGQAKVTLVTPYNGIPKYGNLGESYLDQITNSNMGTLLDDVIAVSAKIGSASTSGGTLKTATKLTSVVIGRANVAGLAAIAIQAGLMVGAVCLDDWLSDMAAELRMNNGVIEKGSPGQYAPTSGAPGVGAYSGTVVGKTATVDGFATNGTNAKAACAAVKPPGATGCTTDQVQIIYDGHVGDWNSYYWLAARYQDVNSGPYHIFPYPRNGATVTQQTTWSPATESDIADKLSTSMAADNQNAWKVGQSGLAGIAPSVNEGHREWPHIENQPAALTSSQWSDVQAKLDASINAEDEAEVEAGTPAEPGEHEATADWEYTPQQMATAQYERDKQLDREQLEQFQASGGSGGFIPPTFSETEGVPEKSDLPQVLQDYIDALPSPFEDMKDTELREPVCSFSVVLPDYGEIEFSFCEWEQQLRGFGDLMLMMVTFCWGLWLFRGRGD